MIECVMRLWLRGGRKDVSLSEVEAVEMYQGQGVGRSGSHNERVEVMLPTPPAPGPMSWESWDSANRDLMIEDRNPGLVCERQLEGC